MRYLMLFVDGFEDVEATTTLDVLIRGKEEVVAASLMPSKEVVSKCGNKLTMKYHINEVLNQEFDGLIIPGGPGSFKIMPNLPIVSELIKRFADSGKLVAAICAAPHLVGKLGYFKNRYFTVHPGFEGEVNGGTYLKDKGVVRDGNFITAKSMYYSFDFGIEIFRYFHSEAEAQQLIKACQGNA